MNYAHFLWPLSVIVLSVALLILAWVVSRLNKPIHEMRETIHEMRERFVKVDIEYWVRSRSVLDGLSKIGIELCELCGFISDKSAKPSPQKSAPQESPPQSSS